MFRIRYLLPLGLCLLAMLPVLREAQGGVWAPIADEVEFKCLNSNTTSGYSVYVVGNHPDLGNWDPLQAKKLNRIPNPQPDPTPNIATWTGKVLFSNPDEKNPVQWKCIVRKESGPINPNDPKDVKWQNDPNNLVMLVFRTKSVGSF